MNELYAVLFQWALKLSGYPDAPMPEVVRASHAFFVENACHGFECKVFGWYEGGNRIYVDEREDLQGSMLGSSIVVHEFVHYLQRTTHPELRLTCEQFIAWEHEAYNVQQSYLVAYGDYIPLSFNAMDVHCA